MSEEADDPRREWCGQFNPEALMADGYEDAILGVAERCGQPALVVYDADKCVQILIDRDGMDYEEAYEFFQFNTLGCWAGEMTPLYLWRYKGEHHGL
jgi:hypothetical protein